MIENLVIKVLSVYAVTFVITAGSIFERARQWVIQKTPLLQPPAPHKHFIQCRMCLGFWVSLGVCYNSIELLLPVYGLSYFLATQER
jgi:hypothetical protein